MRRCQTKIFAKRSQVNFWVSQCNTSYWNKHKLKNVFLAQIQYNFFWALISPMQVFLITGWFSSLVPEYFRDQSFFLYMVSSFHNHLCQASKRRKTMEYVRFSCTQPGSDTWAPGPLVRIQGDTSSCQQEISLVVCPGRRGKEELNSQFQPQVLDKLVFQQCFWRMLAELSSYNRYVKGRGVREGGEDAVVGRVVCPKKS